MKTRRMRLRSLRKSAKADKKYDAVFVKPDGRTKTVPFGASGYSDFTKHKDPTRKQRYITRHKRTENWRRPDTPGSLSRWILWNKKTLKASLADYRRRFKV